MGRCMVPGLYQGWYSVCVFHIEFWVRGRRKPRSPPRASATTWSALTTSSLPEQRSFIFDTNVRELWKAYEIFTMIVGISWAILELIGWISFPCRILTLVVVVQQGSLTRWRQPPKPSLTAQQHQANPYFICTHTPICDYIRRIRPNLMYNCPYVPKIRMCNISAIYFDR